MNSGESSTLAKEARPKGANCYGCAHFFITWDKLFPYACRKMEFRSKRLPCEEVLEADGQPCLAREEKTEPASRQSTLSAGASVTNSDANRAAEAVKAKKKPLRVGGKLNLSV